MVYLYHDDWGFAVLDYIGSQSGFSGQDFTLHNVFSFLKGIYFLWSGRVGGFFVHIYMQKLGLPFIQVFQSVVILAIVILSLIISSKTVQKNASVFAVLFSVLLYFSLPSSVLVGGVYWYSASSTNLWGIPLFLFAVYHMVVSGKITFTSVICMALSTTFHEQLASAVLAYLFVFFGLEFVFNQKPTLRDILKSSLVLLVACFIILAPGNLNRKALNSDFYNSHNFLTLIVSNTASISERFFWPGFANIFIFCLLFSLLFLLFFFLFKKNTHPHFKFFILVPILFFPLYFSGNKILFLVAFLVAFSVALFLTSYSHRSGRIIFAVHIAALVSLLPLLYAPVVAGRSGIIFFFLEFIPILYSVILVQNYLPESLKLCIIVIIILISSKNVITVYSGYRANDEINRINDVFLRNLSYEQRYKMTSRGSVQLIKLKKPEFAEVMPYQRPLIERWMKKYYRLDPQTNFQWVSEDFLLSKKLLHCEESK